MSARLTFFAFTKQTVDKHLATGVNFDDYRPESVE